MVDPINYRIRLRPSGMMQCGAGLRVSFESVRGADETKVEQRAFRMFACARVGPCVLFGARASRGDAKANLLARGEINGTTGSSTEVGPYGRIVAAQEPISNQCRHETDARLQSARLRKQAESRVLRPKQCRNFV
jgi:hypothetical protein